MDLNPLKFASRFGILELLEMYILQQTKKYQQSEASASRASRDTSSALVELLWAPFALTYQTVESTSKEVNQRSKYATQAQQRPESPTVTLTWHACSKCKVHKLRQGT